MITAGYLTASLFFLRFWQRTKDAIFALLGISFVMFAISQGAGLFFDSPRDEKMWVYLLRLAGFALLLAGIVWKNFGRPTAH